MKNWDIKLFVYKSEISSYIMDVLLLNKTFVVFRNVTKAKNVLDQELCFSIGNQRGLC